MPKRYPPLTPQEVTAILRARDFTLIRQKSSHKHYAGIIGGKKRLVTVDESRREFDSTLMKSMIGQSGLTREEFYGAIKATAAKIGLKPKRS